MSNVYPPYSAGAQGLVSPNTGWASHPPHMHGVSQYPPQTGAAPMSDNDRALHRLRLRMDADDFLYGSWSDTSLQGFEFVRVHRVTPDKYFIFVVNDGKHVVLEDGELFPSDTLITQLRLLRK
jgi:hypothetical protein